ncbi:hypothetical protein VTK26DRAFT_3868 [Humicola hyalothermophila]
MCSRLRCTATGLLASVMVIESRGRYRQLSGDSWSQSLKCRSTCSTSSMLSGFLFGSSMCVLLVVCSGRMPARLRTQYCTWSTSPMSSHSFAFSMHSAASSRCMSTSRISGHSRPSTWFSSGSASISKSSSTSAGTSKSPLLIRVGRRMPRATKRSRMKHDHHTRFHSFCFCGAMGVLAGFRWRPMVWASEMAMPIQCHVSFESSGVSYQYVMRSKPWTKIRRSVS